MVRKKKLILVGLWQFGYVPDSDIYCKYLADDYYIVYIGYDNGKKRIINKQILVEYICSKNRLFRKIALIKIIIKYLRQDNDAIARILYFRGCSIISLLFPKRKVFIDYRTGSVSPNRFKNWFKNSNMHFEAILSKNVLSISDDLIHHLKLPKYTKILPLGADIISNTNKEFNSLNILYVGTLAKIRKIHETIYGIAAFMNNHPGVHIHYNIIGDGDNSLILEEIKKYNLENNVSFLGYISIESKDIIQYFNKCNIGVCYAPAIPAYLPQPFTKLYEYALSGMSVISTRLLDSVRKIDDNIGVLCEDNPKGFADAIEQIYKNRALLNSEFIRFRFQPFTWENICKQFKSIINE